MRLVDGYYQSDGGEWYHREVYLEHHGAIPKSWHVHHIDHRKINNEISNLIALPERVHSLAHSYARFNFSNHIVGRPILEKWLDKWKGGEFDEVIAFYKAKRKGLRKIEKRKKIRIEFAKEASILKRQGRIVSRIIK